MRDLHRKAHMRRILYGSELTCLHYLRMRRHAFLNLANLLRQGDILKDTIRCVHRGAIGHVPSYHRPQVKEHSNASLILSGVGRPLASTSIKSCGVYVHFMIGL